ncbi:MAG: flagellar motor switch phosphatase FliY [Peptococcaceae bacterium]
MADKILRQEEIDALLGNKPIKEEGSPDHLSSSDEILSEKDKDTLGEIGNISLGAAATTLSLLLNYKVSITSPRVTISQLEELKNLFLVPCIAVYVEFTDGLAGFNVLVLKQTDTAIIADLMMGGEAKKKREENEELTEMEISAAAEAMNQMIGTAATSLAELFGFSVRISPPKVDFLKVSTVPFIFSQYQGYFAVTFFRLTIGDFLDTEFMQIMDIKSAKEQIALLLKKYEHPQKVEQVNLPEEKTDFPGKQISESLESEFKLEQQKFNLILDIPLKVTVVLGRTKRSIKDVLSLTPGSILDLASLVDEPVEVLINNTLVAKGEVVVVDENFGVRITNIISPTERMQYLTK